MLQFIRADHGDLRTLRDLQNPVSSVFVSPSFLLTSGESVSSFICDHVEIRGSPQNSFVS
jgi:putative NADH-flavin reductase